MNLIHESLKDINVKLSNLDRRADGALQHVALASNVDQPQKSSHVIPTFLGESSFDTHSVQASMTAEVTARDVYASGTNHQLGMSLKLLQNLLRHEESSASSLNALSFPQASSNSTPMKVSLPPLDIVLAAVKRANGRFLETYLCVVHRLISV